jgi:hypothetical protein
MKSKMNFVGLILILITGTAYSQGIYLRAGAGYGLAAATSQIGEKYLHTEVYDGTNTVTTYSTDVVSASYGAGADFTFAVGYKFNENFIFDLDVKYLAGKKYETSDIYRYKDLSTTGVDKETNTTSSGGFFFNPSFIFSAGFGKAAPYGRFGVIASSPRITSNESSYYNMDGEVTRDITWEYKKGVALGYQAGIGMNWKITEKLDFFTEADFVSMTYYAKEGEMTKNIYNGTDYLTGMSIAQKQIVYKKKYDPQAPYNADAPQVAARVASPFSSISAQVGLKFTIWEVVK